MFGPPIGKHFIFFIDDLNMPMLETYGAQPPIELLRQWMDHGGWYDRKQIGKTFLSAYSDPLRVVFLRSTFRAIFLSFSFFSSGTFRQIVDIIFACAMGPPGGGRNPITQRFTRHFNFLSFTEMDDTSKKKIFSTILGSWMGMCDSLQHWLAFFFVFLEQGKCGYSRCVL